MSERKRALHQVPRQRAAGATDKSRLREVEPAERAQAARAAATRSAPALAARSLAVLLSALTLGLTFAHVLELPERLRYGAALWTSLTRPNALYRYFGLIGGPLEVAAVVAVCALAIAVRGRPLTGRLMLGAAALHAAAMAVWLAVVAPANVEIGRWSPDAIPPGWEQWRLQWESGHAASFVLLVLGFCLLVAGLLTERAPRAR